MTKQCYRMLLSETPSHVSENSSSYSYLTERHLQVIWYEQKYFYPLQTAAGETIEVLSPGIWNAQAGPDFQKAHLRIGDKEVRGDVEIHLMDENWYHHQHHEDPQYNQVILHLSLWKPKNNKPLLTQDNRILPCTYLEASLTIPAARIVQLIDLDLYPYKQFLGSGKCAQALFRHLPQQSIEELFQSAAEWRLSQKRLYLASRYEQPHLQLMAGMAMALGYKQNSEAFLALFQFLYPLRALGEMKLFALGLGLCGFFRSSFQEKWQSSPLYQQLYTFWNEYSLLNQPEITLRLANIRPLNHPIRRLAVLAKWLSDPSLETIYFNMLNIWDKNWEKGFAKNKWKPLREAWKKLIPDPTDAYWNHHYSFELQEAANSFSLIGDDLTSQILINTFLPLLYHQISLSTHPLEKEAYKAFYNSFTLPANSKTRYLSHRFFGDTEKGSILKRAQQAQGAYQLHQNFCIHFEASCVGCPFVERYQASHNLLCDSHAMV